LAGFAEGGTPPLNVPSIVGEKGPELFIPRQFGTVIPNDEIASSRRQASNQARAALSASGGNIKIENNGPTMVFDGTEYTKTEDVPAIVREAVKQAEAQLLRNYRNKPGYMR
jgi:hypothetical protein